MRPEMTGSAFDREIGARGRSKRPTGGAQMSQKTITFCFCHTLILTRRCAYRCGYCDYSTTYSRPLPPRKAIRKSLRRAIDAGSSQFHLTGGEGISEDPETLSTINYYGFKTYIEYLQTVCEIALSAHNGTGIFPVLQLGGFLHEQLLQIKGLIPCIKIMLESVDSGLLYQASHEHASSKSPEERLEDILEAGRAGIPTTTGILVGIGESPASRMLSLKVLAEAHKRYGHIQNIVISRFRPRPGTPMEDFQPGNPQRGAHQIWGHHAIKEPAVTAHRATRTKGTIISSKLRPPCVTRTSWRSPNLPHGNKANGPAAGMPGGSHASPSALD